MTPSALDDHEDEQLFSDLRWDREHVCPFCGRTDTYVLELKTVRRRRRKCRCCRRQFSVTKGTILEGSKLSLYEWRRLIQVLCDGDHDQTIASLRQHLNVSYPTLQHALDRLVYATKREPLAGILERRRDR